MYNNLIDLGVTGIYWISGELIVDGQSIKGVNELEYLKKEMKERPRRFLISTRFEGLDLPGLDAIIPLVGTNHRMVIQPVGRSARNKDVLIILVTDSNNRITVTQTKKRRDRIEKEYNVVRNQYKRIKSE